MTNNELGYFEFIVAIVIWFEILCATNLVSKHLQSKYMLIDVAIEKVKGLTSFSDIEKMVLWMSLIMLKRLPLKWM